jgi:DNA-damage-inducible protein D
VEWRKFQGVIEKAKEACKNSEVNIFDHFIDVSKTMELGSKAKYIGLI